MTKPKVCIVHDFLVQYGGAEKVVEALAEIFPDAPIYTAIYKPQTAGEFFKKRKIITPAKQANKLLTIFPILSKYFTFMLPIAFENFDLSEFDIVISSSSSYAKGVLTKPEQIHISYVHTPPRFLYGYGVESTKRNAFYYKPVVMIVDHFLRLWDFVAAQRPDILLTNSQNVKLRIRKFYRRDAKVIYPPVEINFPAPQKRNALETPYYVALGRLAAYKNFDLIVGAFNLLGLNLKILGTGTEEAKLKKLAKPNIKFYGKVSEVEKHEILDHALGLIFPVVEEDFGIVPVEAFAHGIPVLAHKSGGAVETIIEGENGLFFSSLELDKFVDKIRDFDKLVHANAFDKEKIKKSAQKFSKERFQKEFLECLNFPKS